MAQDLLEDCPGVNWELSSIQYLWTLTQVNMGRFTEAGRHTPALLREAEDRVKKLEKALESLAEVPRQLTGLGDRVEGLADRVTKVESQIVQLRTDTRDGFTAVLEVVDSSSKATQKLYDDGRDEMRKLFGDLKGELKCEKDFGKMRTVMCFGEGSSTALFGNTVVVNWDHEGEDFIAA